jgi:hypothetical protein
VGQSVACIDLRHDTEEWPVAVNTVSKRNVVSWAAERLVSQMGSASE